MWYFGTRKENETGIKILNFAKSYLDEKLVFWAKDHYVYSCFESDSSFLYSMVMLESHVPHKNCPVVS